jgi:hypothetical protein
MDAEQIDFPPVGPAFPKMSSAEVEETVRVMARSLAVTVSTAASHHIGRPRLQKTGFANIPQLIVPVICRTEDISGMVPVARQVAFTYLAERGVDDHHLRVTPSVRQESRRRKFTDQHNKSRFGYPADIAFDLSDTLAAAVTWQWNGSGDLPELWRAAD